MDIRTHRRAARRLLLAALCMLPAIAAAQQAPQPLRILFVGNSYIYVNDLPDVVRALAESRGQRVVVDDVTYPNYSIYDHLRLGIYQHRLREGWDWVILQQGPSSLPESQVDLRENAIIAAQMAFETGARVALMAAWPAEVNLHTQANAEYSYRQAAYAAEGCVLPVSTAWRITRETQPGVRLYQSDQLHATREGTLLAAQVIVRGLLGAQPYPSNLSLERLLGSGWRQAGTRFGALDAAAAAADSEPARCVYGKATWER